MRQVTLPYPSITGYGASLVQHLGYRLLRIHSPGLQATGQFSLTWKKSLNGQRRKHASAESYRNYPSPAPWNYTPGMAIQTSKLPWGWQPLNPQDRLGSGCSTSAKSRRMHCLLPFRKQNGSSRQVPCMPIIPSAGNFCTGNLSRTRHKTVTRDKT